MTELEVVVDGQPLNNLFSYRATSRLFTFTADPSLVAFDSCVTGTPQVRGHRRLLNSAEPVATRRAHNLLPGGDRLRLAVTTFEVQVTYNLTIAP